MAAKGGLVKRLAFFLALAWGFTPLAGQSPRALPKDLILLLDTSASMSGSYRKVRDYITGPFLKEHLRLGDTFHIISFSAEPRLEIARRIEGPGDLEAVIGRLFLLYPLEPGSDIARALAYLETYVSQLSPAKPKKTVLISDGEMVPELPGARRIETLIGETKNRLAGQNAAFDFVSLSPGTLPSPGGPARPRPTAPPPAPVNEPPRAEIPPAPRAEVPAAAPPAANSSSGPPPPVPEPRVEEPSAQEEDAREAPPQPEAVPPTVAGGAGIEPPAAPGSPPSPAPPPPLPSETAASEGLVKPAVKTAVEPAPVGSRQRTSFPFIFLTLPVFGGLGFALFLLNRRLGVSPSRAVARAANFPAPALFPAKSEADAPEAASLGENTSRPPRLDGRPLMLNLFVEDQNIFIGKRNVHMVKPGVTFTIGGGKSDFLIFLVPMPFRIADLRYEGDSCLLIPRKPKYFPDTGSSPVKDCLGKTIRIVSDKNYELFVRIELYEDPLTALNRLIKTL